jgi:hypothetical protein
MRFLRYVAGYILWDKEESDEVMAQLGMRKLDKQLYNGIANWLEYLQKISSERAPKQLLYYQPIGRHDPGRPRRRWLDVRERKEPTSSILRHDEEEDARKFCFLAVLFTH